MKRLRRVTTLERFGSSVATRLALEMPLNPAFKRWAKFKGRYASKTELRQSQNPTPKVFANATTPFTVPSAIILVFSRVASQRYHPVTGMPGDLGPELELAHKHRC